MNSNKTYFLYWAVNYELCKTRNKVIVFLNKNDKKKKYHSTAKKEFCFIDIDVR